eukprot:COSAG06_NODE_9907_length_1791_cov_1.871825_3_plen_51_part_00
MYHIRLLWEYEHIMLGGFHIEDQIYVPRPFPTLLLATTFPALLGRWPARP